MKWKKRGLIYIPTGDYDWSVSHAQVPVADYIKSENIIRIYFSTRNSLNRSSITFIEVDAENPRNIKKHADEQVLKSGPLGAFDDCGVMPSWVTNIGERKYLYYIGWNVRNTVPYYNSIGLAISEDGGKTFKKFSEGPLFDRNYNEPYFSASSCVIIDEGIWKNWYLSCTGYQNYNGTIEPRYHIKYAESVNGIDWQRKGIVAIDFKNENEAGIVKSSVIKNDGRYYMWYSYRNFDNYRTDITNSYKIGYAESFDGIKWHRKDNEAGIELSENGWDSEMLAYPHVLQIKNRLLMLYNGNGFGKSGFGYATSEIK